jgi:hypothetical protein
MRPATISRITAGVTLLIGAMTALAAEPNMNPGLWETTITTEMAGMPMGVPPMTTKQCVTKEDLVPDTSRGGQECDLVDTKIDGDTVNWHLRCNSQGMVTEGKGTITYQGDSYGGTIHMTMTGGPMGSMTMDQKISGRRVGDCQ